MDVSFLIQPISPENPCGVNIRSETLAPLYYDLRNTRLEARTLEKNQTINFQSPQTKELWQKVQDLSIEVLTKYSKDLQIVSWLIEALIRLDNFKGLVDGFQLTRELVDLFWDHLYPLPTPEDDKDEIDNRLSSLAGLNGLDSEGTLIFPILNVLITQGKSVPSYTTWQYQRALEIDRITDPQKKQEKIETASISLENFNLSVKETDPLFFQGCVNDLHSVLVELEELDKTLTQKAKDQSPSFSTIKQTLNICLDALMSFAKDYLNSSSNSLIIGSDNDVNLITEDLEGQNFSSREESLRVLLKIADFFAKSEPHSPLPYLIKKAVRWGKTPLPDLLGELIEDQVALNSIFRLVGMEIRQ